MSFRFLSICSGIEAASVAFAPLGWSPVAFSEIEAFPSAVLKHHYPDTPNLGDMTKFMDWPEDLLAQADVICGGTPCQAFSVAGKRESLGDNRGNLTLTFIQLCNHVSKIRVSRNLPAPVILWENVPGVLNTKDNAFGCFLGGLVGEDGPLLPAGNKWANAGCVFGPERAAVFRTLDAQWFGLAQRRKRVFVIASSGDGSGVPEILLEREGVRRDSAPSRKAGEETPGGVAGCSGELPDVADTLRSGSGNPASHGKVNGTDRMTLVPSVCPTLRAGGNRTGGDRPPGTDVDTADSLIPVAFNWNAQADQLPGESTDTTLNHGLTCSQGAAVAFRQNTRDGVINFGGQMSTPQVDFNLCQTLGAKNPQAVAFQSSQSGVRVGEVHATLDSNNGSRRHNGAIQGPTVRRLTPTECERLQGFPDTYTSIPWRGKPSEDCPDGPRYKALGNSWAVPCVAWIGRRLDAFLKGGQQA